LGAWLKNKIILNSFILPDLYNEQFLFFIKPNVVILLNIKLILRIYQMVRILFR